LPSLEAKLDENAFIGKNKFGRIGSSPELIYFNCCAFIWHAKFVIENDAMVRK